jgi:hypothetical protein
MIRSLTRWSVVLVVWGVAATMAAAQTTKAQRAHPKPFVETIYKAYVGKDAKGVPLDTETAVRAYFHSSLADAIIKDRAEAAKRGEVPKLDGDPFVDAQEWDIASFKIDIKNFWMAHANAIVTFTNLGKPKTITLSLLRPSYSGPWRVYNINAPSGSLRALFGLGR